MTDILLLRSYSLLFQTAYLECTLEVAWWIKQIFYKFHVGNILKIKAIYWTSLLRTNAMIYGNDNKTLSPNENFLQSQKLFYHFVEKEILLGLVIKAKFKKGQRLL